MGMEPVFGAVFATANFIKLYRRTLVEELLDSGSFFVFSEGIEIEIAIATIDYIFRLFR
jgi:hypothetical protein